MLNKTTNAQMESVQVLRQIKDISNVSLSEISKRSGISASRVNNIVYGRTKKVELKDLEKIVRAISPVPSLCVSLNKDLQDLFAKDDRIKLPKHEKKNEKKQSRGFKNTYFHNQMPKKEDVKKGNGKKKNVEASPSIVSEKPKKITPIYGYAKTIKIDNKTYINHEDRVYCLDGKNPFEIKPEVISELSTMKDILLRI